MTPFARFQSLLGMNLTAIANPSDLAYLHQSRLTYAFMIPRTMAAQPDGYWMILMAIVAVAGGVVFRRTVGLFAAWFLVVALGYVAFGGLWHPGAPNIRLDLPRYWLGFLPALIIAFVGTLTMTTRYVYRLVVARRGALPREWRAVGVVVLTCLLLVAPLATTTRWVRSTPSFVVTNHGVMSEFRNWMHVHDRSVSTIFTDYASSRQLPVYLSSFAGHRMAHAKVVPLGYGRVPRPGTTWSASVRTTRHVRYVSSIRRHGPLDIHTSPADGRWCGGAVGGRSRSTECREDALPRNTYPVAPT